MERNPSSSLAASLLLLAFSTPLQSAGDALFSSNFESQEQTSGQPGVQLQLSGTLNDDDGIPGATAGDTISYTFKATNTGDLPLTSVQLFVPGDVSVNNANLGTIAPGSHKSRSGSHTLTAGDLNAGIYINTSTVTAQCSSGCPVQDSDSNAQHPQPTGGQFCDIFYTDSDGDNYGENSNGTEVCSHSPAGPTIPNGMSDNNLDCDDNNANANPGQAESRPNNSFADENCDGVDGNLLNAIFVSEAHGSDSNFSCGSQFAPCQSIGRGISRLSFTGKTQLYVAEGTYDDALDLESDVEIYGGYDQNNWSRSATNDSIIVGELSYPKGYAIQIESNVTAVLSNLVLIGPDAHTSSSDMNSYVVYAKSGSHLTVDGSELRQGNGRNGTNGDNGSSANQSRAPSGSNGSGGLVGSPATCELGRSGGGGGGINTACAATYTAGGSGGQSGQMDTGIDQQPIEVKCIDEALSGDPGGNAGTSNPGQFGFGGQHGSGLQACGIPTPGANGRVIDGEAGSAGTGGSLNSSALWFSGRGGNGVIGQNGTGGGGGGGAGGCDIMPQARGGGGGGGGAGGCSASAGGSGGYGGGGSFGIFINDGTLVVKNTLFLRGVGGNGGKGGNGGSGQPGGFGGAGGHAAGTAVAGAPGGLGGRGGHSGGGGGGAGGPSCGILAQSSNVTRSQNNQYQQGQGGIGGNGGGGPVTGTKGQNGSLCEAISQ